VYGHASRWLRARCVCVHKCVPRSPLLPPLTALPRRRSNQIGDAGAAALASSLQGITAFDMLVLA
jgi:hypothetical protein